MIGGEGQERPSAPIAAVRTERRVVALQLLVLTLIVTAVVVVLILGQAGSLFAQRSF